MRAVQVGPVTGLIAQVLLLLILAGTVGLGGAGWAVGIICAVVMDAALARGLHRHRLERLGPAMWVTITRATLAVGVVALVADSLTESTPVGVLVVLSTVALALDLLDGWLARRTDTATALGARFDGEVDAFLILALSVYVAQAFGAWVLLMGLARYLYLVGEWLLSWMRAPLPARYWRKVTAAVQGVTLTVAAAGVLPSGVTKLALVIALGVLVESFGRDIIWLWRRRHEAPAAAAEPAEPVHRGPVRTALAVVLTLLALLVVWVALLAPNQFSHVSLDAFARLPIELLVLLAVAVILPTPARRLMAGIVGLALGLLVIVKVLDMGFKSGFDRPFNPVDDYSYAGLGIETMRETIGPTQADLVVAAAVVLLALLLLLPILATLRVTRVAAGHRRWTLGLAAGLGVVWGVFWVAGTQIVTGSPVASTSAAFMAVDEGQTVREGLKSRAEFTRQLGQDRFAATPGDQLLTGLRGKDVMLVFVESYGKVALENPTIAPRVEAVVDSGTSQLQAAGFQARSGWLTSSTFGGISWLAHSTMQSGLWIDGQRRYDQLVTSGRFTLSKAFKRAGWRTTDTVPAHTRNWPEGLLLYGYDKVYDSRNVGYRGPSFAYATMPDQYVLSALQQRELAPANRPPVFAEVDLVSSHTPWTRIPQMTDWEAVGDGTIFNSLPVDVQSRTALFSSVPKVRAAYGKSIEYTLNALISFVQHYGNDDLVLIMLGDHQPATLVTGENASHDVPISVIARDPAVMSQIAGWDWDDGLRPGADAPVWRMDQFRDRFLSAFGSQPTK